MLLNRILRINRLTTLQPSPSPSIIPRHLSSTPIYHQQSRAAATTTKPSPHGAYYKTHGRALFKSLTLAFLSYQIFYWAWLTLESEMYKDEKNRTIHELEGEVRMLSSGQGTHVLDGGKKRLLDEEGGR